MAVLYGSKLELPQLLSSEIGFVKEKDTTGDNYSIWSWLLTIGELGAFLIPGIGAVGSLAIGAAFAGIRQAVDVSYGKDTTLSTALNFGLGVAVPAIGVVGQGLKNIKIAENAASAIKKGAEASTKINELFIAHELAEYELSFGGSYSELTKIERSEQYYTKIFQRGEAAKVFENVGFFSNPERMLKNYIKASERATRFSDIKSQWTKWYEETTKIYQNNARLFTKNVGRASDLAQDIADRTNKSLRNLGETLELTERELKALASSIKNGVIVNRRLWERILGEAYARSNNPLIVALLAGGRQEARFIKLASGGPTNVAKAVKALNKSAQFSKKVLTLISSPERLIKKGFDATIAKMAEHIGEHVAERIALLVKRVGKTSKELEEEFIKSGGALMASEVIMGYKVLYANPESTTILIQFRKEATMSTTGKNKKGKPPVFQTMSNLDLAAFIKAKSPMGFYLDNFARSRGGRSATELGLGEELTNLLGFLPVNKINQLVGLASMAARFGKKISSGKGKFIWQERFYADMGKIFKNELIGASADFARMAFGGGNNYIKRAIKRVIEGSGDNGAAGAKQAILGLGKSIPKSIASRAARGTKGGRRRAEFKGVGRVGTKIQGIF